jgi:hypothetical protein
MGTIEMIHSLANKSFKSAFGALVGLAILASSNVDASAGQMIVRHGAVGGGGPFVAHRAGPNWAYGNHRYSRGYGYRYGYGYDGYYAPDDSGAVAAGIIGGIAAGIISGAAQGGY